MGLSSNTAAAWVACAALGGSNDPSVTLQLLDNASFVAVPDRTCESGVPWWLAEPSATRLLVERNDGARLSTPKGVRARQPLAVHAPRVATLVIEGTVLGPGTVSLLGSGGRRASVAVGTPGRASAFRLAYADFVNASGIAVEPRIALELAARDSDAAQWSELRASIELAAPDETVLRATVERELDQIFRTWLERGLDARGPRSTAFVACVFDACTGDEVTPIVGGFHPLYSMLFRAQAVTDDDAWRTAFERFVDDWLELGFEPSTGLPRWWDCVADRPLSDQALEIGAPLGFLIDLAEHGPESRRARARALATRAGGTVLAQGVMPDGVVAPIYRPSDGAPSTEAQPLRRLDVPLQLARLAQLTGDRRFLEAARGALSELEFTHRWPGGPDQLDPGFDDEFGHYAARSLGIHAMSPTETRFLEFVGSGFDRYAPLWRSELERGGSLAADQVRSWEVVLELGAFDAEVARAAPKLLEAALHAHLKGEQYDGGAWGDVTQFRYDARSDLAVGDLPGAPANLLRGIALLYDDRAGLRGASTRAWFSAVLEASRSAYARPYGWLSTAHEQRGANHAGASLRVATALVTMLENSSRQRDR